VQVSGKFSPITDDHPVVASVLTRWRAKSKPGRRSLGDNKKIALAIEGGGMRGCVSAGATAALNILGLDDTIDVVYGSSAGAMIAAYFISRQFSGMQ
jgi:predicted acylesterase/phospholipase RssA